MVIIMRSGITRLVYPWRARGSWNTESCHARTWTREIYPTLKGSRGLCGLEEKEFFSSHYVIKLYARWSLDYEVYQTTHEMWEALKEKHVGGFNYKAKITYNEIWKLKDATEPYNETTS